MTDHRYYDADEVRELRPHERDPDAESPEPYSEDVTLELARLAGEVWGNDGTTCAAEYLANMDTDKLNALALRLYATDASFRASFDAAHRAGVIRKMQGDV